MSTSIDHVEFLSGSLRIRARDLLHIRDTMNLPEINFVDEHEFAAESMDPDAEIPLEESNFWSATSSCRLFNVLTRDIAPYLIGTADLLFYWECSSPDGWRFDNGRAIQCEVRQVLVPPEEKGS